MFQSYMAPNNITIAFIAYLFIHYKTPGKGFVQEIVPKFLKKKKIVGINFHELSSIKITNLL